MEDYDAFIKTEGKTDWMHLSHALKALNIKLKLSFDASGGDKKLLQVCEAVSRSAAPFDRPQIYIFDRDDDNVVRDTVEKGKTYKYWGNNVYSFPIPVPEHREGYKNISIEFYYSDEEIKTADKHGRRLYLSSEFNEASGKSHKDSDIHYGNRHHLKDITHYKKAKIIDGEVFNNEGDNIALPKYHFAKYIYKGIEPFSNFECHHFGKIFCIIEEIVKSCNSYREQDQEKIRTILRDHPPAINIFVGRESYINDLQNESIKVAAITGIGGQGKSTLAAKLYEMAYNNATAKAFDKLGWCDCRELENTFHSKLLALIDDITDGAMPMHKYAEENIQDSIHRFIDCLNTSNVLVVFDNIDAYVDASSCSLTGIFNLLFNELTDRLTKSLVIFTCRASLKNDHYAYYEIPIKGMSYFEASELAHKYGVYDSDIGKDVLAYIHDKTNGHALWLCLIFAQFRNRRITVTDIKELLSKDKEFLNTRILGSIWNNLDDKEKAILRIISYFTRPHDLHKIVDASETNYDKCKNIVNALVNLNLLVEIKLENSLLYDVHPLIRIKAQEATSAVEKVQCINRVINVLCFGDWRRLRSIIEVCDYYNPYIDRYVECAEIAIENDDHDRAIEYIYELMEPLRKYGNDAKYIQLCKDLYSSIDHDKHRLGIDIKYSGVFTTFIRALQEQGEFMLIDSLLDDTNKRVSTIHQYIYYADLKGYNLWFQNRHKEAVSVLSAAFDKIRDKGETVPSSMYNNYALAKRDAGDVDEALALFYNEVKLEQALNWDPTSRKDLSANVGNIGRCLYLKGDYATGLKLCEKSVQFLSKGQTRHHNVNYGYGLLWIADIYIKLKNIDDAKKYISKCNDVWKQYCPARLKKLKEHLNKYPEEYKAELELIIN